ncbi:hypothetical protein GCM10010212_13720 [Paenarthrobacter nicotinovorans]|nr:hypothetical protein GCM10010212_13720 [Paenarthrobacter nicotinovorans]
MLPKSDCSFRSEATKEMPALSDLDRVEAGDVRDRLMPPPTGLLTPARDSRRFVRPEPNSPNSPTISLACTVVVKGPVKEHCSASNCSIGAPGSQSDARPVSELPGEMPSTRSTI